MEDNFTEMEWRTWSPLGEGLYAYVLGPTTPVTGLIKRADAVRIVKCVNPLKNIPNEALDDIQIIPVTQEMMQEFFTFIADKDELIGELQAQGKTYRQELSQLRQELAEARKEIQDLKNRQPNDDDFRRQVEADVRALKERQGRRGEQ